MTTAATAAAAAGLSSTFFTIAKFTTLAASIVNIAVTVSYTHLTLPTICSV